MADQPVQTPEQRKAQLLDQLLEKNPDIRDATLKALQTLNPDTVLPEVRADQKISAAIEKAKTDALAEFDKKQKERDFNAGIEADREAARTKFKLNDEEFKKVEHLMADRKIASYESAADYYRLMTKPAEPTPSSLRDHSFEMPDRKEMKELWENPRKWARNQAFKALDELNAKKQS